MKRFISIIISMLILMSFTMPTFAIKAVAIKGLKLDKSSITLESGKSYALKLSFTPVNTTKKLVKYSTSNKNVASVDAKGKVTAVNTGSAVITVTSTSDSKIFAKCTVTVTKKAAEKPVKIRYLIVDSSGKPGKTEVFQKLNKIAMDKINVDLKVESFGPGEYQNKINVMLGANEEFDLMFTCNWYNLFGPLVAKGGLKDISDLLPKHAPKTYGDVVPLPVFDAAKVDGRIYAVPNMQILAKRNAFIITKEAYNKVKDEVDFSKVRNLRELEPVLEVLQKEYNPEGKKNTAQGLKDFYTIYTRLAYNYEVFGGELEVGVTKYDERSPKIFNQFEQPEFKDFIYTLTDFMNRKLITNIPDRPAEEGIFSATYLKPGLEAEMANVTKTEMVALEGSMSNYVISTSSVQGTMTGVSNTSKNPGKALEVIELMNTDTDFMNTLCYGIEGRDYSKIASNRIKIKEDAQYIDYWPWSHGNTLLLYLQGTQPDSLNSEVAKINKTADVSTLLGFVFDATPVTTELANCNAVVNEYMAIFTSGKSELAKDYPTFLKKLKEAGANKVIAEKQKQVNAFKAAKK